MSIFRRLRRLENRRPRFPFPRREPEVTTEALCDVLSELAGLVDDPELAGDIRRAAASLGNGSPSRKLLREIRGLTFLAERAS